MVAVPEAMEGVRGAPGAAPEVSEVVEVAPEAAVEVPENDIDPKILMGMNCGRGVIQKRSVS
jgi:hypothetical protein